jgi:hypothetical protein
MLKKQGKTYGQIENLKDTQENKECQNVEN